MATKTRAEQLQESMDRRFAQIDEVKGNLEARLSTINAERDNLLNETLLREASDDYLRSHFNGYDAFISAGGTREEFVKGKDANGKYNISMDQKLAIIAEHQNTAQIFTGSDKFSADLSDTQKIKSERKKRYKQDADEVLVDYKKILDENEKLISTLEHDIEAKKQQIRDAENKLTDLIRTGAAKFEMLNNGGSSMQTKTSDDVAREVEMLKNNIAVWKKELKVQEKELESVRELQNKYVAEFAKRKNEIITLLEKGKIFSGAEQQGTTETKTDETKKSNTSLTNVPTISEPKKLAKSMLDDFYSRTPSEQKTILAQCGSRDILNAARHLGVIERRKLDRVLEARIDELDRDLTFTDKNGRSVTIDKSKLANGVGKNGLSESELSIITDEINRFNDSFDTKSLDEIKAFEDKMQYVRFAAYKQETGWFRGITKHFDFLNKNKYKMYELSNTLARYASIKNDRERNQLAQLNKWRKTLKLNPMNDIAVTNPRALDRTGQDPIHRQDYFQDEGPEL